MIQELVVIDRALFLFVNSLPHPGWFVTFMMILSGVGIAGIVWILLGIIVIVLEEVEDKRCLAALFLAAVLTRVGGDMGLKVLFGRLRPESIFPTIFVLHGFPIDRFSFPSTHTVTAFAGAYILSREHPRWKVLYYGLATLIAFSRVYLGYHFPFDVLAGGFLGLAVGYASYELVQYVHAHIHNVRKKHTSVKIGRRRV